MKRFGVIGQPIAHSLSPLLHNTAFSLLELDCRYDAIVVEPSSLPSALRDFKSREFAGLNVTIPHKETIVSLVDELSDEAKAVGAVNTLSFTNDRVRGDNTDVYGIAQSLDAFRKDFDQQAVLVLGAGGSARATTFALLTRFSPAEITVANRGLTRARDLVAHFDRYTKGTRLRALPLAHETIGRAVERASLIINATPVGMFPSVEGSPVDEKVRFHSGQTVLDLIYTPLQTRFLDSAARDGARTISGLEMFLYQGARSFELWLGLQMPVDDVRPVILNELNKRESSHTS